MGGSTSLSGAIDFSARLLRTNGHIARGRIIDVSGDGSNNQGRPAAVARDETVAAGITINGLPILAEEPALDTYYRKHVVGGPGAFLVVAKDFASLLRCNFTQADDRKSPGPQWTTAVDLQR